MNNLFDASLFLLHLSWSVFLAHNPFRHLTYTEFERQVPTLADIKEPDPFVEARTKNQVKTLEA